MNQIEEINYLKDKIKELENRIKDLETIRLSDLSSSLDFLFFADGRSLKDVTRSSREGNRISDKHSSSSAG